MLDVHHGAGPRCPRYPGEDGGRRGQAPGRPACGRRWPRTAEPCVRSAAGSAGIGAAFEPAEASLIADLVDQVRQLLADPSRRDPGRPVGRAHRHDGRPGDPPDDPAVARLLPDFHAEDAELSAGLRVLHEPDLIAAKDAAAVALLDSLPRGGGTVRLDEDDRRRLDRARSTTSGWPSACGWRSPRTTAAAGGRRGPARAPDSRDVRHLPVAVRGAGFAGHRPAGLSRPAVRPGIGWPRCRSRPPADS